MVVAVVLLLSGAAVLWFGAESAIRGARRLARPHEGSSLVRGALMVGTGLGSLGAALVAAGRGQTSIAAGAALGTIVFLFSAGFGAALLMGRRPVEAPPFPVVVLPAGTVAMGAVALADNVVTRGEGIVLLAIYAIYANLVLRDTSAERRVAAEIEQGASELLRLPPLIGLLGGLAVVVMGAWMLIDGGIRILARTSLSAGFVGAALVGALAGAHQMALGSGPIRQRAPEQAAADLFATAGVLSTGALGLAALVRPLAVDSTARSAMVAAAAVYAVVATVFLIRGRAGRLTGLVVIGAYAAWIVWASGT